ncbi:protein FLOWERING LOCUS T [Colletotrichum liriopes]|uniref:Protein FLOWERING LOCUS T n=1 Tax=Colletotrichum liriopes TaxID=708192 RepID=A0AA37GSA6_9PEZI|nr:protein FLOWERING LOCUS T [Colletotrichum liriopes]
MHHSILALFLSNALTVWAATPSGFQPASKVDLIIAYGDHQAVNGVDLAKSLTQSEPTFGTTQPLTGKSYAIIMVDIDIPTNNPPATGTFLHWAQTDLTPAAKTTKVQLNDGQQTIHSLTTKADAIAAYKGPAPPAKVPLSHRYVQVLVDTSNITAAGTAALKTLSNRSGVQVNDVLAKAGLTNMVVAGNFFTVSNPGPAANAKNGTTTTAPTGGGAKTTKAPSGISLGEKSTRLSPAMLLGVTAVSLLALFASPV